MTAASSVRRLSRWVAGISAMVMAGLLVPSGAAWAVNGVPVPPNTGLTNTGKGVLSAADKDFVVKVRLAGLWEIPAGNLAVEKSNDPRIVSIGRSIAAQHVVLDKLDRDVAKKLGIDLPNQPNGDQLGWLSEMRNANGKAFDQIYIDRLRAAHGKIFPAIATIRASTRNDSVRRLAQQTNQFVMTHMTLLESSGIVDFVALPTAPPPAAVSGPVPLDPVALERTANSRSPGANPTVILLVLAVAVLAGVITTMRMFRRR